MSSDKTQEAFERRFGPEPHCKCNPRNLDPECPLRRQLWEANRVGYLAGRQDLLTELRQIYDAESGNIRELAAQLRALETVGYLKIGNQSAGYLTNLLDANAALRARAAELEGK